MPQKNDIISKDVQTRNININSIPNIISTVRSMFCNYKDATTIIYKNVWNGTENNRYKYTKQTSCHSVTVSVTVLTVSSAGWIEITIIFNECTALSRRCPIRRRWPGGLMLCDTRTNTL